MRAGLKLLSLLAVASVTAAGCGDDGNLTPVTDTSAGGDTEGDTSTGDDTAAGPETTGGDTSTGGDTTTNPCGSRECGTFAGVSCGTCAAPEECNSAGRCEVPGQPLGAYCGVTAECNNTLPEGSNSDQYPGCLNARCESETCLSTLGGSAFVLRDVCTQVCQLYKDSDNDGINDEDAPNDDCNPADIVDGPAGNKFRCVNFAEPGRNPFAVCVPGTTYERCDSSADCPEGEVCEITNMIDGGMNLGQRCVAAYRENDSWNGKLVGTAGSCDSNPASGENLTCGDGLCFGFGCVPLCQDNADCDTTKTFPGTGCVEGKCAGSDKVCTNDVDCSAWTCGEPRDIFGQPGLPLYQICWPGSCTNESDCGDGFYCRFGWNGEVGDASGPDNLCFAETAGGAELGEACDQDPDDAIPGATCKASDYCFGGFCSGLCQDDTDCNGAAGQKCAMLEFPVDADEDGEDDALLPFEMCLTFEGSTGSCASTTDCAEGFSCEYYIVAGPDADAPHVAAGQCVPNPENGKAFGELCQGNEECDSGFCLGASATSAGFCSKLCAASSQCGDVTIEGEEYSGFCRSYLYSRGGTLSNYEGATFISLCVPAVGSLEDCSGDYACSASNEFCFANAVLRDPTVPGQVEYLCSQLYADGETAPSKALGEACDVEAEVTECASGLCLPTSETATTGYCTQLCTVGESPCGNGTTCSAQVRGERRGAYVDNAATFGFCEKP